MEEEEGGSQRSEETWIKRDDGCRGRSFSTLTMLVIQLLLHQCFG